MRGSDYVKYWIYKKGEFQKTKNKEIKAHILKCYFEQVFEPIMLQLKLSDILRSPAIPTNK